MLLIVITVLLAFLYIKLLSPIVKRIILVEKLRHAAKELGAELSIKRLPFLSLFRLSAKTEITFETDDTVYLIRLISSQGLKRAVHFASDEYIVSFTRVYYNYSVMNRKTNIFADAAFAIGDYANENIKVRILPKHERCKIPLRKNSIDILIFNPAPDSISCLSGEKNSVKVLEPCDNVAGSMIFTCSSFITYVNMQKLKNESKQKTLLPDSQTEI